MKNFYCSYCDKTMSIQSKRRHEKSRSHFKKSNYIKEKYTYNIISVSSARNFIFEHVKDLIHRFNELQINIEYKIKNSHKTRIRYSFYNTYFNSKLENLTINYRSNYEKMTTRLYLEQPHIILESKLLKYLSNNPEERRKLPYKSKNLKNPWLWWM